MNDIKKGYILGLFAVLLFSMTVPATKVAIAELPIFFLSSGRTIIAAILAIIYLIYAKKRIPDINTVLNLFIVGICVAVIFPLCISYAMKYTNASHGGIVLGILPLTTAAVSTMLLKQKLSKSFWLCAVIGSLIVVIFSLQQASGKLQIADICLFIAVIAASFGYVKGAKLTQKFAGIEVISWALVLVLPIIIPIVLFNMPSSAVLQQASVKSWLCFLYMALISQYLGFLPWYKGLALGGVAQVGQLQLLQPFFTLIISAFLLNEYLSYDIILCCIAVMLVVYIGRRLSYKKIQK